MAPIPQVPGMDNELDENFKDAVNVVVNYDRASASLLQRRLKVGYARAARLIDQLEDAGVLGPAEGSSPREVLIHSSEELLGSIPDKIEPEEESKDDDLLDAAARVIIQYDRSSASLLQRRLSIGYARAARLIDELEEVGVVTPANGADPRVVLIKTYDEFVKKRKELAKKKKKSIFETPPTYSVSGGLMDSPSDLFEHVYFGIKVLKLSALVIIPYWLFGFQLALLIGLILICLFLSKISLTIQDLRQSQERK